MSSTHNLQSHFTRFVVRLLELGIIPRGEFTLVETRHDTGCIALITDSGLDCNCDCEIEIGGRAYSYAEFVRSEARL